MYKSPQLPPRRTNHPRRAFKPSYLLNNLWAFLASFMGTIIMKALVWRMALLATLLTPPVYVMGSSRMIHICAFSAQRRRWIAAKHIDGVAIPVIFHAPDVHAI
jgi:hypothetical protein